MESPKRRDARPWFEHEQNLYVSHTIGHPDIADISDGQIQSHDTPAHARRSRWTWEPYRKSSSKNRKGNQLPRGWSYAFHVYRCNASPRSPDQPHRDRRQIFTIGSSNRDRPREGR